MIIMTFLNSSVQVSTIPQFNKDYISPLFSTKIRLISIPLSRLNSSNFSVLVGGVLKYNTKED